MNITSATSPFFIEAIPVHNTLQNYIWILRHQIHRTAVAIDPTQADLVLDYCQQHQLDLKQIWITHKHQDHIAGIKQLVATTAAQVYVPYRESASIPYFDVRLKEHDTFQFEQLQIQVIETAGHTLGHICFYLPDIDCLFCGDTLFMLGCGRVFEGTLTQMYQSLQKLAALPPQTYIYCAHEYTESNAEFAITIDADNIALQKRYQHIKQLRAKGQITIPSLLSEELATNPFLRCQDSQQFATIRTLKDNF